VVLLIPIREDKPLQAEVIKVIVHKVEAKVKEVRIDQIQGRIKKVADHHIKEVSLCHLR
jgi:uncharacterized protein YneF (UPF0154 family)